ncbi:MAG: BMP family ABC transporter substrate-binding protein [Oscillospiraceae bacterium]
MKKFLAILLVLALAFSFAACKKTEPAPTPDEGATPPEAPKYKVCNVVNGNLGDKSFFDSAEAGLQELKAAGRIELETKELGGTDADRPKWESTVNDIAAAGEYDYIVVSTWQMPEIVKAAAEKYPEQKFIYYDYYDDVIGALKNVCCIEYAQNQMGYMMGVFAAMMTSKTDIEGINADKVVGFVGGGDQPVINDFLYGFLEGVKATDPEVKVDTRYTESFVDTGKGKELALAMVNDNKADIVWGVAGGAGNGGVESAVETKTWFIGVDSDQELTLPADQAARTLTSGLKNCGASLVWFFDELDAGKEHLGEHVRLDLTNNGVGIVTDKNFAKIAPQDVQDAVKAAEAGLKDGTIKVSTAIGDETNGVVTLRDTMKP